MMILLRPDWKMNPNYYLCPKWDKKASCSPPHLSVQFNRGHSVSEGLIYCQEQNCVLHRLLKKRKKYWQIYKQHYWANTASLPVHTLCVCVPTRALLPVPLRPRSSWVQTWARSCMGGWNVLRNSQECLWTGFTQHILPEAQPLIPMVILPLLQIKKGAAFGLGGGWSFAGWYNMRSKGWSCLPYLVAHRKWKPLLCLLLPPKWGGAQVCRLHALPHFWSLAGFLCFPLRTLVWVTGCISCWQ